ncbi:tRNA A37 threonylcarbamoyladenosine synthetase subunit TsaC/SUA5/YrdC [Microbacterium sp. cf046]|nr:tRNA A37 threonylcarbamoyladenosine synthetase subunit TsaC/SUA5/YrdC [Microbacterium sp. cf046]
MEIVSFDDRGAVARAVEIIRSGEVVGAHFGTVFGLIVDGAHAGVAERIMAIKGAGRGFKPLGICVGAQELIDLIDAASLPPEVQRLLGTPWFAAELACMIAVRAPAHPTHRIPEHLISENQGRQWVQVFDPRRMPGTFGFIEALWHAGVQWVAATSMNEAGSTEIVEIEDAAAFCRRHSMPLLFESSAPHNALGSLPILELNGEGLRLDRQGIIALADLERAVGLSIDASKPIPAHFPPMQVPAGLLDDLSPAAATRTLVGLLYPDAK